MSDDPAYDKIHKTMSAAVGPSSTAEQRREFQSQLITIAPKGSFKTQRFFITLVSRYFAEFEDLQDAAIDALLDMCEDEEEDVRVLGIKGLGPTAKSDPRWVRGNTGVLLQLLASTQPNELKQVGDTLGSLIEVSPTDVFSVMADDCRGSEEETGASRNNILDFLLKDTVEKRARLLESGNHLDVEEAFRKDFVSVLADVDLSEKKKILELLLPLSTVSGRNASKDTVAEFVKIISLVVPAGSRLEGVQVAVQLFKSYINRVMKNDNVLDPRLPLYFLSLHGSATAQLALASTPGNDSARLTIFGLQQWVESAVRKWEEDEMSDDPEMARAVVVKGFINEMLQSFLTTAFKGPSGSFESAGPTFEILLFAAYILITRDQSRTQFISSRLADQLRHSALRVQEAMGTTTNTQIRWMNIKTILEVLSDPSRPAVNVTPSWLVDTHVPRSSHIQASNRSGSYPQSSQFQRPPPQGPRVNRGVGQNAGPWSSPYMHQTPQQSRQQYQRGMNRPVTPPHFGGHNGSNDGNGRRPPTVPFHPPGSTATTPPSVPASALPLAPFVNPVSTPQTSKQEIHINGSANKRQRDVQDVTEDRWKRPKSAMERESEVRSSLQNAEKSTGASSRTLLERLSAPTPPGSSQSLATAPMAVPAPSGRLSLRDRMLPAGTGPSPQGSHGGRDFLDSLAKVKGPSPSPAVGDNGDSNMGSAGLRIKNRAEHRPALSSTRSPQAMHVDRPFLRSPSPSFDEDDPEITRKGRGHNKQVPALVVPRGVQQPFQQRQQFKSQDFTIRGQGQGSEITWGYGRR